MYREVELFEEPLTIKSQLKNIQELTTAFEQAFLCGIIKERKPRKIVEVGVAAGGTTAVILNCIHILNLDSRLYSVDLATTFDLNGETKQIGFYGSEVAKILGKESNLNILTGKTIAERIQEIGEEIEMLFLDTSHMLPGELLDFIVTFPYLAPNAVVVLHDISLNCYWLEDPANYATKVLFDVVGGDKLLNRDPSRPWQYPNIGAFYVTKETEYSLENCISALTMSWKYCPSEWHLEQYRKIVEKKYSKEYLDLFDRCVSLAKMKIHSSDKYWGLGEHVKKFNHIVLSGQKIWILGAGYVGRRLAKYIKLLGGDIEGFCVSDGWDIWDETLLGKPVCHISDIKGNKEDVLMIAAVHGDRQDDAIAAIKKAGYTNIYPSYHNNIFDGFWEVCEFAFTYVVVFGNDGNLENSG